MQLGGRDLDFILVDVCIAKIKKQFGIGGLAINDDIENQLIFECEKAKVRLSNDLETTISFCRPHHWSQYRNIPDIVQVVLTRSDLEAEAQSLLGRIEEVVSGALSQGSFDKDEIHEIVLMGGSTRIPVIR